MAREDIRKGNFPNDPNADTVPEAFEKVNRMFEDDVYPNMSASSKGIKPFEAKIAMDGFTPGTDDPEIALVMNDPENSFNFATTDVDATNNIINVNNGLSNDEVVQFSSTGTIPGGLSTDTDYYIINAASGSFQVSTTKGGSAVDILEQGSGTHNVTKPDNNGFYRWDGSSWVSSDLSDILNPESNMWVSGKAVSKHIRRDQIIGSEQTDFIESSTNLFNAYTITEDKVILASGVIDNNENYSITDLINVEPGHQYIARNMVDVAWYDSKRTFIMRESTGNNDAGTVITAPENAYYMRFNFQGAIHAAVRQINKGDTLLAYEPFSKNLSKHIFAKAAADSIDTANLKPSSVMGVNTEFLKVNSNHFNKSTENEGYNISSTDGTLQTNADYNTSDYIPVRPGDEYSYGGFNALAYYDENKRFLHPRITLSYTGQTETVPSEAYYIRVHYQPSAAYDQQVNEGPTLLNYEKHKKQFVGDLEWDKNISMDRILFDLPIHEVFDTDETYPTDYSNFNNTTAAAVYQMYDDLMALYPDYITKEVLGQDLDGNNIALYKFTPAKPDAYDGIKANGKSLATKYPKIFLTTGTHGHEHVPGLMTYLMFEDICSKWQNYPLLEALRFNVDFLVIPVVNPSGWDAFTRKNSNGVDINRNFPEGWGSGGSSTDPTSNIYQGPEPLSELEAQYVSSVFDSHSDIDIMYDFHNFSGDSTTDHFIWIPTVSNYVQPMSQRLISRLTRKWRDDYTFLPSDHDYFVGYSDRTNGGMIQDHAYDGHGISLAATFEVCGRWWLDSSGSPYDTNHKVSSVEALANWLLINLSELEKFSQ